MSHPLRTERRRELLAERALHGLTAEAEGELQALLPRTFEAETSSYERAAAALHLAFLSRSLEPLPSGLYERLAGAANLQLGRGTDRAQGDD